MDRAIAVKLLDALRPVEDVFNALSDISLDVAEESERHALRLKVANAMVATMEVERFVVQQFPDLDPAG